LGGKAGDLRRHDSTPGTIAKAGVSAAPRLHIPAARTQTDYVVLEIDR